MDFDSTGLEGYETDPELEKSIGVWLVLSYNPKIRMCVLRAGGANSAYTRMGQTLLKPFRHQKNVPEDTMREVMAELYSRTIVIEWEGITANGQPVPCTPKTIKAFLLAKPNIFDVVQQYAETLETFAAQQVKEVAEELGNSSSGTSNTIQSPAN